MLVEIVITLENTKSIGMRIFDSYEPKMSEMTDDHSEAMILAVKELAMESVNTPITQRVLSSNGGVVVCIKYEGGSSCCLRYRASNGKHKTLTLLWGTEAGIDTVGSSFYVHIDDETNDVLVVSKDPFPY
jgi:hypothetical protein